MRRLIRTDGTSQDFDAPLTADRIADLIGADVVDTVSLRHMGSPLHIMIVDDHGYETQQVEPQPGVFVNVPMRALKPFNAEATDLYHANCVPGTAHRIVGHAFVCPDSDFGGVL